MRPQHNAAENSSDSVLGKSGLICFNEAAA